jgi:hypothetical protein
MSDFVDGTNDWGTKVRVQYDTYDAVALVSTSVVNLGNIPAGARVTGFTVNYDGLGAAVTGTIKVGAATAAAVATMAAEGAQYVPNKDFASATTKSAAGAIVSLTTGGATGTGTIALATYYTVED